MTSNLPPGVTDRMIEDQVTPQCYRCGQYTDEQNYDESKDEYICDDCRNTSNDDAYNDPRRGQAHDLNRKE